MGLTQQRFSMKRTKSATCCSDQEQKSSQFLEVHGGYSNRSSQDRSSPYLFMEALGLLPPFYLSSSTWCFEMEKEYDQHLVLKTLDNPIRILFWNLPDFMMLILPFFVGMLFESTLLFLVGIALRIILKRALRRQRKGSAKLWVYWHFPTSTMNRMLKTHMPASHIRKYLH